MPILLTLISRAYCHLCHEMERELRPLSVELGFEIQILDADSNSVLQEMYDERVPVLLHEGHELCHYFLDNAKVRDYLSKIG